MRVIPSSCQNVSEQFAAVTERDLYVWLKTFGGVTCTAGVCRFDGRLCCVCQPAICGNSQPQSLAGQKTKPFCNSCNIRL